MASVTLARFSFSRQVAESTGYSAYWIGQLARRYNTQGTEAMRNRQRLSVVESYRRPMLLSPEQQDALRQALAGSPPGGAAGDLWTARVVADWMSALLGRTVAVQRGWDYLQRLCYSPQVPRPRHTQADPQAQAAFKKSSVRS